MQSKPNSAGFTLIELMIVIAIIGILASVAVPSYGKYVQKTKFSEVIQAVAEVKKAVEMCYMTTHSLTVCDDATTGNGSSSDAGVAAASDRTLSVRNMDNLDVVYINPVSVTIVGVGTSDVNNKQYHLNGIPQNGSLVWTLDEGSSDCDEVGLC